MVLAFAMFLVVHGLIHLLGFAKAFGLAALSQLHQPISPLMGILWLAAALLFVGAAACLFLWPRGWWTIGAVAIAVSLAAIVPSWADAKFGALANGIALVGVLFGFLAHGPLSLQAMYDRDVDQRLVGLRSARSITDADLARLPAPVQRYLRVCGVLGQPHVWNFRARMHGRIRSGPDAGWMPFTAEQYNFVEEPVRLFYMTASRFAVPLQGYHRYIASAATMRIKVAALVPIVDAAGETMTQGETVTMFNDMCVLAPQTLIDPAIVWRVHDAHVEAVFTNAGHTIRAVLEFNEAGELVNFRSDDRYQTSPDGKTMTRVPWSTPIEGYRAFGSVRLAAGGEGRWHGSERPYAYIELHLDDVQYNVASR